MRERVPENIVDMIFKLNLPMKLIANGKKAFPFMIKSRNVRNDYIIILNLQANDVRQIHRWGIELKGRVDVEFLKFVGDVQLTPLRDEPGCYIMNNIQLYKENLRQYKRVPYRRSIQIVSPIQTEAVLINISASGAMIYSTREIGGQELTFKLILAKKPLELTADIVEEKYDENEKLYVIRCHFNPINHRDMKHINNVVKEIILMAKERLK